MVTWIDFVLVILIAFAIPLVLGTWARRRVATFDDFMVAGRTAGSIMNGIATMACWLSALAIVGSTSMTYVLGITWDIFAHTCAVLSLYIVPIVLAGPFRKFGKYTLPDYLTERYDSRVCRLVSALIVLIVLTIYISPQIKGGALALQSMLGWDFIVSAIVITAVYVAYLAMAGVMATTLNEFYFGLIMIIGCAVLNVVVYTAYGGFTALWEGSLVTKPGHYIPPPLSPLTFIGQAIGSLFLAMSMPHLAIRLFTSRDIVAARRSWWIAGCTALMVWILGGWLPGIAALARFPGLRDPDLAFYKVLELAGTGIIGLGMGAVLAAIISTTDGMLMAVGAAGAYDVYGKTLRPTASERSVRRVMVAFMVLIGAISCVLTIYTPPWIPLFAMLALHLLGSAFAMPLLFGIYWPRATKYGAISSMIAGLVACFTSYFLGAPIFSWALFGIPTSAAAMVIASLLTKPPRQEIVEKLCLELRRIP